MRTDFGQVIVIALALQMLVLSAGCTDAMALGISPGAFCAQGVPVGEKTDTGVDITITNDANEERILTLKLMDMPRMKSPSLRGYSSMPDLSWFVLDKTEVTVPAHGKAKSRITIDIPDDERYYNQHWGISCLVEYSGQKGLFQEAIKGVYMVETKAKADVKARPAGNLGLAPTILAIDPADTAGAANMFTIYNNTGQTRVYRFARSVPETSGETLKLNPSPGFAWVADADVIAVKPDSVSVKAGATARVRVSVGKVDATKDISGTEVLVFVESDKKEAGFVRVQLGEPVKEAVSGSGDPETSNKSKAGEGKK